MVSEAVKWAVEMYNLYIAREGTLDAYVRGCHYFAVSLPEHLRQIPARGIGKYRTYRNTKGDYKRLSELLVDARIAGLLNWDLVTDKKNDPLIVNVTNRHGAEFSEVSLDSKSNFDLYYDKPIDYDEMLANMELRIRDAEFNNQSHRMILVIEKSKAKTELERLCEKYGADCIQFGGQLSVTRVHQICQQAKKENKPLRVFYLADMDIAGWFMPQAFMKRVQDIYSRDDHKLIRIGLTREQITEYQLPGQFDANLKKYPQGQVVRFAEETGSLDCVEIDSMPKVDLLKIVNDQLALYAGLEKDEEETDELEEELQEILADMDLSDYKEKYTNLAEEFNENIEELKKYQNLIDDLSVTRDQIWELENEIRDKIAEELKPDDNATEED